MVKIDLITGFLGSGKTTFIKKYAAYLMAQGESLAILENDFGAVNVDMMLLSELTGEQCELEMVSGGCDADCHRRRFKTKLIAMGMCGYDRVLVEPSGIFDVDEFFDVLREEPLDRWYRIDNCIAIVDAALEENLSDEAEYLLASEAANAGSVVLSKCRGVSEAVLDRTVSHLNRALERVKAGRRISLNEVLKKDWEELNDADFAALSSGGYRSELCEKQMGEPKGFQSLYFMKLSLSGSQLAGLAERIFKDADCGRVFRIKGFSRQENGQWLQLNATRREISVSPIPVGQEILIVIGEELNEEQIRFYLPDQTEG